MNNIKHVIGIWRSSWWLKNTTGMVWCELHLRLLLIRLGSDPSTFTLS